MKIAPSNTRRVNRLALAAIAAVTALAPMTASAAPRWGDAPANSPAAERREERRDDRRDARRDARQEARYQARWDRRQHNGYMLNGRWYYGQPQASYLKRADFQPGYRAWQRGARIPAHLREPAYRVDYRAQRLAPPPRGYHYVRDDRGAVLLVGIATGVVLSTVLAR